MRHAAFAALLLAAAATPAAAQLKELNVGIISTEASKNLRATWEPFLEDMAKKTGYKVTGFYASDYAGVIEALRFNKVQVAWFGNASAIQAVDRAGAEVFVQRVDVHGNPGYWSLIVVHKDSPLKSLEDLIACGKNCTFGNGDPNSTSGFHVPLAFAFAPKGIDPKAHFKTMTTAGHEANSLAVANKQVDAATNNTENLTRLEKTAPAARANIREIWRSPLIPSDPMVWRKDLPEADKAKIKAFFLSYGREGENKAKELEILKGLLLAPFRESSDKQLVPIRLLILNRDLLRAEQDKALSDAERAKKVAEIKAQIAKWQKELN